ncbi:MAG: 3-oxoacyl-(acyl-carrier-protein) reductase FabG [Lentisphaerae bacterium ADurb.Bin242]|nr:MAG: 3-oxoacyl-(acyl-carrier-protein) reductase FabG [Lentisphaerae bacterium ADurb.Bin242]
MCFQGKTAIVTGGGGYIGGAIGSKLSGEGASVALFDLDAEKVHAVAAGLKNAKAYAVDLTDPSAVEKAVGEASAHFGKIDFLVTAAGGSARSRSRLFAEQSMNVVREVIEINLFGVLNAIHAVAPQMIRRKWGKIVNLSSLVAVGGVEGCADYAAAKAGVIAATRTLAMEFGPYNIQINCVCPGKVQRPGEMPADPEAFAHRHSFLNRICFADDIAGLVLFLLSEKADYITGQNYIIDGGRSLGLKGDH